MIELLNGDYRFVGYVGIESPSRKGKFLCYTDPTADEMQKHYNIGGMKLGDSIPDLARLVASIQGLSDPTFNFTIPESFADKISGIDDQYSFFPFNRDEQVEFNKAFDQYMSDY